MRKDGKYRFTLQFSANSEEQIRVGELLEKLGNRKSTIIVSALSDYINAHPELQSGYSKIEVKVAPAFDRSQMERLIRSIVEEKLSELHTTETIADTSMSGTSEALEEDITKMLDNLDMFNYEDIPEAELLDLAQCESWLKITRMQSPYDFEEERLTKAFMELPLKRRQVMELLFLEDLSEAETAKRLNCSLQYVRNQRCIALKRLRSRLMEGGDDE